MTLFPLLNERIPGSKHFTWREALWLPSVEAFAKPSELQQAGIIAQAKQLDRVRDHFGRPLVVHVWLRPAGYNKLVGGAPQSRHLLGRATDFHILGIDSAEVKKELMQLGDRVYSGRGEADTTNWVHLDLDPGPWFSGRVKKS